MRDQAFRNLLIGYNIVYGLALLLVVFAIASLVAARDLELDLFNYVVFVFIFAPCVAVNIGAFKRKDWGAWVALTQSTLYLILLLTAFFAPSRSSTRSSAESAAGAAGATLCWFACQVIVGLLAWRALRAPKDDTAPIVCTSGDSAVEILALAFAADGHSHPEALKLVLRFAEQLLGPVSVNPAFKARILRIVDLPDSDARLARAAADIGTSFEPQEKQWLLDAARAICTVSGPADPLAEEFLNELQLRINARSHQEPFGSATR